MTNALIIDIRPWSPNILTAAEAVATENFEAITLLYDSYTLNWVPDPSSYTIINPIWLK